MRSGYAWLLIFSCACALAACSGDRRGGGGKMVSSDDGSDGGSAKCVDRDHDGYGDNCSEGIDCDDKDPGVTDECTRCVAALEDCPCELGTKAKACKPDDRQGDGGVYMCSEGSRFCRDGYWSGCEAIGDYVFVPTQ